MASDVANDTADDTANDVADVTADDVANDKPRNDRGVQMRDPRDEIFVQERPWGQFEQFVSNERVTVKIITVQPGHRLSLQTHENRGEFWQVLDGAMEVTVGEKTWTAEPGEKVWAPQGAVHRMANHGEAPCRMLEVAFGDFDEADIVRLQDDYAR